jgi:hypothetical protein
MRTEVVHCDVCGEELLLQKDHNSARNNWKKAGITVGDLYLIPGVHLPSLHGKGIQGEPCDICPSCLIHTLELAAERIEEMIKK